MRKLATAVGAFALIVIIFLLFPLIGSLVGAFAGWVVGLFFEDTILSTLARFGVDTGGLAMWQLGCTLGFIGGFFKTSVSKSED